MAEVTLYVAGRAHNVACRDGEEAQLEALGRRLNAHAEVAARVAGGQGGERVMLFVALMLADELTEAERGSGGRGGRGGKAADDASAASAVLDRIAGRLESLADALEKLRVGA